MSVADKYWDESLPINAFFDFTTNIDWKWGPGLFNGDAVKTLGSVGTWLEICEIRCFMMSEIKSQKIIEKIA